MTTEDRLSPTHPSPPLQKGRTEKRKYFISKRSCGNTAGTAVSAAINRRVVQAADETTTAVTITATRSRSAQSTDDEEYKEEVAAGGAGPSTAIDPTNKNNNATTKKKKRKRSRRAGRKTAVFRLKKKSAAATAAVATSVKLISDTPLAITTGKTPLQQQQQPSLSHPSSSIRYISSKEQEREQEREEEEEEDDMDEIFNIQPGQSERRPVQVYSSSSSQQNNNTIISNASSGVTNHEFEGPPAKRRRIITTATVAPTDTECSESMGVHIVITGLRDGSSSMDLDGDDNYEEEDEMKKEQDRSENAGGGASTDQDENTSPDHQNQLRQLHESSSSASSSNSFQRQVVNNTMTVSADANVGGGVGNKSKGKQKLSDIMVDGALDNAVKTVTAQRTTHCDVLLAPPRKSSLAPRAAKSHHLHPQPPPHRAQQQPTKGIKRKKKTTSLNARVQQQPPSRTVPFSSSRLKQKQKQPAIISLSKEKQQTFALMEALSQLSIDNLELRVIECRLILEAIYNNNSNASSSSSTTTATPFGVLKRVLDQDRGMIQSQSQLNELGSIVGQSLFARLSFKEWMNEDRIAFSVFHLKMLETFYCGSEANKKPILDLAKHLVSIKSSLLDPALERVKKIKAAMRMRYQAEKVEVEVTSVRSSSLSTSAASKKSTTGKTNTTTTTTTVAALPLPPLVQTLLKHKLAHEQRMVDQMLGTQVGGGNSGMKHVLGLINTELHALVLMTHAGRSETDTKDATQVAWCTGELRRLYKFIVQVFLSNTQE